MKNPLETIKQKASEAAKAARRKADDCLRWCDQHREATATIIVVGVPTLYKFTRSIIRAKINHDDMVRRDLMTYDRRTDSYLQLRRKLHKKEQLELSERMAAGEGKPRSCMIWVCCETKKSIKGLYGP